MGVLQRHSAWAVGGQHAGRRHHESQRPHVARPGRELFQQDRACGRTLYAHGAGYYRLRSHDRRSPYIYKTLENANAHSAPEGYRLARLRVCGAARGKRRADHLATRLAGEAVGDPKRVVGEKYAPSTSL